MVTAYINHNHNHRLSRRIRRERWKAFRLAVQALFYVVLAYYFTAHGAYALRHPEKTDTQRFLDWRGVIYWQ